MAPSSEHRHLSRRAFLRLVGLGAFIAACGPPDSMARLDPTPSPSVTLTPQHTSTPTTTATHTLTPTTTPSNTPSPTATSTATSTPGPTPTATMTPTPTPTRGPLRVVSLIHGPSRALVVDHVLQRFGVLSTQIRVDLGETVPDLRHYDAVIFAGGEYRPEEFEEPFFQAERQRIMEALEANVPILGICLGHQLLAYWLGGEVKRGRWEIGWLPVTVDEAGLQDPLLAGLGESFHAFLWHGDQVSRLPKEAILLASSERCAVQAYRLQGQPVWGVQFNPQYDPVIAEGVVRSSAWLSKFGWDPEEIITTGYQEYDDLAGRIFGNFLGFALTGEDTNATPGVAATPDLDFDQLGPR